MSPAGLAGRRVLVTRPAGQAAALARLIREAGGEAVEFPALEIVPVDPAPDLPFAPDAALCVSPNAARFGLPPLGN